MKEMSVVEQRYKAVLAVIGDGRAITEVAAAWGGRLGPNGGITAVTEVKTDTGFNGWVVRQAPGADQNGVWVNSGSWSGSNPYVTTTATDYVESTFVGTEFALRVSTASGDALVVDVVAVDGVTTQTNLNMTTLPSTFQPFVVLAKGLTPLQHKVKVTVKTGTFNVYQAAWLSALIPQVLPAERRMLGARHYGQVPYAPDTGAPAAGTCTLVPVFIPRTHHQPDRLRHHDARGLEHRRAADLRTDEYDQPSVLSWTRERSHPTRPDPDPDGRRPHPRLVLARGAVAGWCAGHAFEHRRAPPDHHLSGIHGVSPQRLHRYRAVRSAHPLDLDARRCELAPGCDSTGVGTPKGWVAHGRQHSWYLGQPRQPLTCNCRLLAPLDAAGHVVEEAGQVVAQKGDRDDDDDGDEGHHEAVLDSGCAALGRIRLVLRDELDHLTSIHAHVRGHALAQRVSQGSKREASAVMPQFAGQTAEPTRPREPAIGRPRPAGPRTRLIRHQRSHRHWSQHGLHASGDLDPAP
jgi:hypothetical protein